MPKPKRKISSKTLGISIGAVAGVALLTYFLAFSPYSPIVTQTPTSNLSTFKLISSIDGEDVSSFIEISIWIPDDNADFEDLEDIYTWSEFEEEESSKDADDVSIDLSDYAYVWVEIDPDAESVFSNNHYLITPAGKNYAYTYRINHMSSDVNFMCLDNTSAPAWYNFTSPVDTNVGGSAIGDLNVTINIPFGWDMISNGTGEALSTFPREAVQENMTLVMNVPEWTFANTHNGANWAIENSDYDDFSNAELEFHHDEANWRRQAPIYIPANDLEKSGETSGLESLTDAFCIRWTYNTTVSTTDAANTQINMTITDNTPAEIIVDGTFIYMIFTEAIDFEDGAYICEFEYEEAHRIYATDVSSGRILVPRGSQSLGAFTAYSVAGL